MKLKKLLEKTNFAKKKKSKWYKLSKKVMVKLSKNGKVLKQVKVVKKLKRVK